MPRTKIHSAELPHPTLARVSVWFRRRVAGIVSTFSMRNFSTICHQKVFIARAQAADLQWVAMIWGKEQTTKIIRTFQKIQVHILASHRSWGTSTIFQSTRAIYNTRHLQFSKPPEISKVQKKSQILSKGLRIFIIKVGNNLRKYCFREARKMMKWFQPKRYS